MIAGLALLPLSPHLCSKDIKGTGLPLRPWV